MSPALRSCIGGSGLVFPPSDDAGPVSLCAAVRDGAVFACFSKPYSDPTTDYRDGQNAAEDRHFTRPRGGVSASCFLKTGGIHEKSLREGKSVSYP